MNWRRFFYHLAFTLVVGVAGTVAGGFMGGVYVRLFDVGGWDVLSAVLGGLMLGGLAGLLGGFIGAFFMSEDRLRQTALIVFLIDVVVIVVLALADYFN